MEYESDRALNDPQLEEAKRKAFSDFETYLKLKGEVQDPMWVKPADHSHLPGAEVDAAQGFWINGGKTGSKKDEPLSKPETFDHDLPTLPKEGVKDLPKIITDESAKLTTSDIEKRITEREEPMIQQLNNAKNMTVDQFNVGVNIGPNGQPVYRRQFPQDEAIHLSATSLRISPQ